MRCCDCQFRKDCSEIEPDDVAFKLCGTRIEKLVEIELKEKLESIRRADNDKT